MIARLKRISKFGLFGILMFTLGSIYTAVLMIFPHVAYAVLGQ